MPFDGAKFVDAALPEFAPRRNQRRLDYRPVAWSLRNRPEEWCLRRYTLLHFPSDHVFWVGTGGIYLCEAPGCSCQTPNNNARPTVGDWWRLRLALRAWKRSQRPDVLAVNRQFAAHFLTPEE